MNIIQKIKCLFTKKQTNLIKFSDIKRKLKGLSKNQLIRLIIYKQQIINQLESKKHK
jgi:hypothetical protein